tara:strand:- start:692 stop:820 length:129 start_codon:yes stop_codon:yes gene_type:complete
MKNSCAAGHVEIFGDVDQEEGEKKLRKTTCKLKRERQRTAVT